MKMFRACIRHGGIDRVQRDWTTQVAPVRSVSRIHASASGTPARQRRLRYVANEPEFAVFRPLNSLFQISLVAISRKTPCVAQNAVLRSA
jgi:hypothetical protein